MNTNIKLDVTTENGELVIRMGEAAPIIMPVEYSFAGLIDAPALFYVSRYTADPKYFDPKLAVIMVDLEKRTIKLVRDVNDPNSDKITGTIFGESLLPAFKINSGDSWRPADLAKFLKRNKMHFDSADVNANVVSKLTKLKVETSGEIVVENDNRGNKEQSFKMKTTSEIPESFVLKMPIFSNGQKLAFKVDIEFDVQGSTVLCFLESDDLYQQTVEAIKTEIQKQLDVFKLSGIPILYK